MMPMHLFLLTIVKRVLKSEMTYEEFEKNQRVETFYNESRDKAYQHMNTL